MESNKNITLKEKKMIKTPLFPDAFDSLQNPSESIEKVDLTLTPLNRKVIVRNLDEGGDKIINGIIIPSSAREASHQAKVISSDFEAVKEGDIVLYSKYSGCEFELNKEKLVILDDVDILCKIKVNVS